ncbi:minichromosome maintenance protein MCM [Candidatus Micrarchaeota archaeon]|nr:minichromosome maintenance protein MCM [Candidatus Micrarchaeota archaeon]
MEEVVTQFEQFFDSSMRRQLTELASAYPEKRSLEVDFAELEKFNTDLADGLLVNPDEYISAARKALANSSQAYLPASVQGEAKKFQPHVRVKNLRYPEVSVQFLGSEHLNKLVKVDGVVSWITQISPCMKTAVWECLHCEHKEKTFTDKHTIKQPRVCSACARSNFKLVEESSEFINIQRANMQDLVENLRGNAPTTHVELWMEDDIVNRIAPGEKVTISGILRLRPVKEGKGQSSGHSSVYAKFLDVVHLEKKEEDFEELEVTPEEETRIIELSKDKKLYEKIVKSIAPGIFGYDEMKQSIALQLFGGTPNKFLPDGQRIRNDVHVLLIGDPGTSKSTLLSYVSRLAPKCIMVGGKSASSVGLTASAEKDEITGGWILKAGAMVLANGGMVCVDELDKMNDEDRGAMHQSMEQQIISVAKAGLITQFQSRTSVLAAANPKHGRFDPNALPAQQFDLSPTLLSRFDLIFPIRDVLDESQDRKIASHILLGHKLAAEKQKPEDDSPVMPAIPIDFLRKYIAFARKNIFPILSQEASDKIKEFYLEMRRMGKQQNNYPITARYIEGIIRLSEASAKVRLSQVVEVQDAERAIALQQFVLKEVFMDKDTGRIDSDIISIGQPKSKIDKMRTILSIIGVLEKKFDQVDIDDVVKDADDAAIDNQTCRRIIDDLLRQGELFSPKPGYIKNTTRSKD